MKTSSYFLKIVRGNLNWIRYSLLILTWPFGLLLAQEISLKFLIQSHNAFHHAQTVAELAKLSKVKILKNSLTSVIIEAPKSERTVISQIPSVQTMQEYFSPQPQQLALFKIENILGALPTEVSNNWTGFETGFRLIHIETAWQRGLNGSDEIIAIADTGIDRGSSVEIHPDLKGAVRNLNDIEHDGADLVGHGTHLAGLLVGSGRMSGELIKGGAFASHVLTTKIWSDEEKAFLLTPDDIDQAYRRFYRLGARIILVSWGMTAQPSLYDAYAAALDHFAYLHPDTTVVVAAGNAGSDLNRDGRVDSASLSSVATAKNVISVGSSENDLLDKGLQIPLARFPQGPTLWPISPLAEDTISNHPMGLAGFSSRGPTLDGRIKPDLVAPGSNIASTRSLHPNANRLGVRLNDYYFFLSGTSQSAALVAASTAVVRQYLRKFFLGSFDMRGSLGGTPFLKVGNLNNPSSALIKALLLHTATDLHPGQFGLIGEKLGQEILSHAPNSDQGFGRIDVENATQVHKNLLAMVDDQVGLRMGENFSQNLKLNAPSVVQATLVYTDYPSKPLTMDAMMAADTMINDLDLNLYDSTGRSCHPDLNHNSNVESVMCKMPAGEFKLSVTATKVIFGSKAHPDRQPFALVITRSILP